MIVRSHGGPEVIERENFSPPPPGTGEVLIEHQAIGLNFMDTYYRTGLYKAPLPITLGSESVGVVIAKGPEVEALSIGDRVGCINGAGAYATHRIVPADRAVRIPEVIGSNVAAATMLKGFTASYLAEDMIALEPGQAALVHSAAGGVGSILVPWLRDKGVIVIAHAGSPEKAKGVEADHVLSCPFEAVAARVREITGGKGVDVVYDGVGRDSWDASLTSLKRRGLMVSYGNASGAVPPVSLLDLMQAGSLYVSRPTLADYTTTREELSATAQGLFDRMERGVISPFIGQRFALCDAADAHRALEARQTSGSTVLTP
ncbi:MAG: quinone oxidoreductase [Novosphingobium sp.]|nr:quinone oxidoreductase [Novosphingobium sp.]MCB2080541.1 quinone oxidoreductase [Novosphingobium sp.]